MGSADDVIRVHGTVCCHSCHNTVPLVISNWLPLLANHPNRVNLALHNKHILWFLNWLQPSKVIEIYVLAVYPQQLMFYMTLDLLLVYMLFTMSCLTTHVVVVCDFINFDFFTTPSVIREYSTIFNLFGMFLILLELAALLPP